MIQVTISTDPTYHELVVEGHAGYDRLGRDIVCAGASALMYALCVAAGADPGVTAFVTQTDDRCELCCRPDESDPAAPARLRAMFAVARAGFRGMGESYGDYIEVREVINRPAARNTHPRTI